MHCRSLPKHVYDRNWYPSYIIAIPSGRTGQRCSPRKMQLRNAKGTSPPRMHSYLEEAIMMIWKKTTVPVIRLLGIFCWTNDTSATCYFGDTFQRWHAELLESQLDYSWLHVSWLHVHIWTNQFFEIRAVSKAQRTSLGFPIASRILALISWL